MPRISALACLLTLLCASCVVVDSEDREETEPPVPQTSAALTSTVTVGAIDGTFEVVAGSANYVIPVRTAPGAGGLAPQLKLVYNHHDSTELLGVGWSLAGLPSISRCPATHAQDNFAAAVAYGDDDRFCLDGQRLIAILPGPERARGYGKDGTVYHTESNEWTRVRSIGDCNSMGGCYFVAQSKTGLRVELGHTSDSNVKAIGQTRAYQWRVNRVSDISNNYYEVDYAQDKGIAYPRLLRYTYNQAAGLTANTHAVEFVYDSGRSDSSTDYRFGEKRLERRLKAINFFIEGSVQGGYSFTYDLSPATSSGRLTRVSYCMKQLCFKDTVFSYLNPTNGFDAEALVGKQQQQNAYGDLNWTVDVTGDGFPDQVYYQPGGAISTLRNSGRGTFESETSWGRTARSPIGSSEKLNAWIADINGDGLNDFVYLGNNTPGVSLYAKLGNGSTFGADQVWGAPVAPDYDDNFFSPQLVDANGDGRLDLMIFLGGIRVLLNTGSGLAEARTWAPWSHSYPEDENSGAARFADMNGDKLVDMVTRDGRSLIVRLNQFSKAQFEQSNASSGYGFSAPIVWATLQKSPLHTGAGEWVVDINGDGLPDYVSRRPRNSATDKFELAAVINNGMPIASGSAPAETIFGETDGRKSVGWDGLSQWLADVNGDGFLDYLYLVGGSRQLNVNINAGGRALGSETTWAVAASKVAWDGKSQWIADVNADGTDDYLYLRDGSRELKLVTAKGGFRDLLESVDDGLQAHTQLEYGSLVKSTLYRITEATSYPWVAVTGARSVVSSHLEANGSSSGAQVRRLVYSYENGFADLTRGGLFSFGSISVDDGDKHVVRTAYFRGFPLNGRVRQVETRRRTSACMADNNPSDCAILARSVNDYTVNVGSYTYQDTYRVLLDRVRHSHYDGTGTNADSPRYVTGTDYTYDAHNYDNVLVTRELGDTQNTSDDVFYCRSYSNDTAGENWRIGFVTADKVSSSSACQTTSFDPQNDLSFRQTSYFASNMKAQRVAVWDDRSSAWRATNYLYDGAGNPTHVTNPLGATVQTVYDAKLTFPIEVRTPNTTRGEPLVSKQAFDPFYGSVTMTEEASGLRVENSLDGMGRVIAVSRGSAGNLRKTETFTYAFSPVSAGTGYLVTHRVQPRADVVAESSWLWKETGFDAWSREIYTREKANDGKVTRRENTYDAKGRVLSRSVPFFEGGSGGLTTYLYDAFDNIARTTSPNGTVETFTYHLGDAVAHDALALMGTLHSAPNPAGGGNIQTREYKDVFGNVRRVYRADGTRLDFDYDKLGRLVRETMPNGAVRSRQYGSAGEPFATQDPDSGQKLFSYDLAGRLVRTEDAMGHVSTVDYDALGRVTQQTTVSAPYFEATLHGYIEDEVLRTHFEYDDPSVAFSAGRLTRIVQPEALKHVGSTGANADLVRTTAYDVYGNVTVVTTQLNGRTMAMQAQYDPAGRLIKKTFPDGATQVIDYGTDPAARAVYYQRVGEAQKELERYAARDAWGHLTSARQPTANIVTTRTFDALGRPATMRLDGVSLQRLLSYTYTWSAANKLTGIQDHIETGRSQTFSFDSLGQLKRAAGAYGTQDYAYDVNGNLTMKGALTLSYPAGSNLLERVTGIPNEWYMDYLHDDNGAVIRRHHFTVPTPEIAFRDPVDYYSFNGRGQMTSAVIEAHVVPRQGADWFEHKETRFAYDAAGERIATRDANGDLTLFVSPDYEIQLKAAQEVHTHNLAGPHGLIATYTYNQSPELSALMDAQNQSARGQMTSSLLGRLGWTAAGTVSQAWAQVSRAELEHAAAFATFVVAALLLLWNGLALFGQWSLGRLRRMVGSANARIPALPLTRVIAPFVLFVFTTCLAVAPTAHAAMVPGQNGIGKPSAEAGGYRFFHQDHRFSTALVTDGTGREVARVNYEPFGGIYGGASSGTDNFRQKFVGSEWEADAQLFHMGSRYYDPVVGRFLSPDTLQQFASGYEYAANDPLTFVDPDGNFAWLIIAAIAVGVGITVGYLSGVKASGGDWDPTRWDWNSASVITGVVFGFVTGSLAVAGLGATGMALASGGWAALGSCQGVAFLADAASLAASVALDFASVATDNEVLGIMSEVFAFTGALAGVAGIDLAMMRAACFVAGTQVLEANGAVAIEDIEVGDRVLTTAGDVTDTEVDPETWRKVHLTLASGGGEAVDIEMLRPNTWILEQGVRPGRTVHLSLEEMHMEGDAKVLSVEPAPKVKPGKGRVVLSTFTRMAAALVALVVTGVSEPVVATASHPFYSATQNTWVPAGHLEEGELVQTQSGTAVVEHVTPVPGSTRVFNLEVEAEHEYFVSAAHVRVHNSCNGRSFAQVAAQPSSNTPQARTSQAPTARYLYHYTDEAGYRAIRNSQTIHASLAESGGHADFGNGVYLTDLEPESHMGDLAQALFLRRDPNHAKIQYWLRVNAPDAELVHTGRRIFLVRGDRSLALGDRFRFGSTQKRQSQFN